MEREERVLREKAQKLKMEAISELGAIDFHFQIPKFDSPLMTITSLLHEIEQFSSGMQEFHTKKLEDAENLKEEIKCISYAAMFGIWNTWNTVIGMVLTSGNPEVMAEFGEMMQDFAKSQMNSDDEKGN